MRRLEIVIKEMEQAKKHKHWNQVQHLADELLYIVQTAEDRKRKKCYTLSKEEGNK